MNINTFNNSRKIIIEDDNSVLMFEDEEVILVRKFMEKIQADFLKYICRYTSSGRLTTDMGDRSSLFGQINKIEWVHYPSEGRVRASQKLLTIGQFCDPLAVWAFQVIPVNQNSYEIFTFGRFLLNN